MSNPVKILVIDDEVVGRQLLEAILTPENYNVSFAENGLQGLDLVYKESPDLILCDVMMPGMDGFEVCQKIRKDTNISQIPVFLITALDDRDSRIKGIDAGADDYISKPFDRLEILGKIKNSLSRLKLQESSQEKIAISTGKADSFNTELLEGLLHTLSGDIDKESGIELYRTNKQTDSKHFFSVQHTKEKTFCYMVSNTLEDHNAVIFNCLILNLLHQASGEADFGTELIDLVLSRYHDILSSSGFENESKLNVSIVAIMHNKSENSIMSTGLNYVLLVDSSDKKPDVTARYKPLTPNSQPIKTVSAFDHILFLSPNLLNTFEPAELCAKINDEIDQNGEEKITIKIPEIFKLVRDVLVVKMTF